MKILIWRTGAYGDCLIITPLIRHLHNQGHQIFIVCGDRGEEVLRNNPHVYKILPHDKTVKNELLGEHMQYLMRKHHCDRLIDLNESIECALSQHPRSPNYKLPKQERLARFNRNFYEYAFEHAKEPWDKETNFKPELFFEDKELESAKKHLKPGQFNVLIGLAGSGNNKCYPYMMDFCNETSSKHPDVHFITVGDTRCQLLEDSMEGNITKLSGNISMRESMALTGLVDLVIAPDTGIIHASGCYDTPKICILGHTTKEHITKHFSNDYSIEADEKLAPCAPCSYMIYNMKLQCPLNPETQSSVCLADGIPMTRLYERFRKVYDARL